jgi:hypothetical protein
MKFHFALIYIHHMGQMQSMQQLSITEVFSFFIFEGCTGKPSHPTEILGIIPSMTDSQTIQKITDELTNAYQSEAAGNLGRARVCARRAAGWAIQVALEAKGGQPVSANALDNIKYYATLEGLSPKVAEVLEHLTIKVVKDSFEEDSYYPLADVDLIAEAQWLAEELLGETLKPEKP